MTSRTEAGGMPADVRQMERSGRRFAFGRNWLSFAQSIDEERIAAARASVERLVGRSNLAGVRWIDVGCGSGLFSLAAHRLGADVTAFDFDADSVECTRNLLTQFSPTGAFRVQQGSILDADFVRGLGHYDVVYSWGVLHHTGRMSLAFDHVRRLVSPGGTLVIAIYNDQGWISRYWSGVKRIYNTGAFGRAAMIAAHLPYLGARFLVSLLKGRSPARGMRLWHDFLDWLGGYPFEVATPQAIVDEFASHGFVSRTVVTCGRRHGCNEFMFQRSNA